MILQAGKNMPKRCTKVSTPHSNASRDSKNSATTNPSHWSPKTVKANVQTGVNIAAISKKCNYFDVFRNVLEVDKPAQLNKGRDVKEKGEYNRLDLVGAWRIENQSVWQRYNAERIAMRADIKKRKLKTPHFFMRKKLFQALSGLPGFGKDEWYSDCNETYLIHGTGPDNVLPIVINGISPPHWEVKALFGKGIYFAEDCAKNDQYGVGDNKLGQQPLLHKILYDKKGDYPFPKTPYKAYYIILCRVLIGYACNVLCTDAENRTMINNYHEGFPIFADEDERELAMIPGVKPPMRYHSLVAKKGGAIVRFREFANFHAKRVCPEYIVAYTRR